MPIRVTLTYMLNGPNPSQKNGGPAVTGIEYQHHLSASNPKLDSVETAKWLAEQLEDWFAFVGIT